MCYSLPFMNAAGACGEEWRSMIHRKLIIMNPHTIIRPRDSETNEEKIFRVETLQQSDERVGASPPGP